MKVSNYTDVGRVKTNLSKYVWPTLYNLNLNSHLEHVGQEISYYSFWDLKHPYEWGEEFAHEDILL